MESREYIRKFWDFIAPRNRSIRSLEEIAKTSSSSAVDEAIAFSKNKLTEEIQ